MNETEQDTDGEVRYIHRYCWERLSVRKPEPTLESPTKGSEQVEGSPFSTTSACGDRNNLRCSARTCKYSPFFGGTAIVDVDYV